MDKKDKSMFDDEPTPVDNEIRVKELINDKGALLQKLNNISYSEFFSSKFKTSRIDNSF
jgi:hypothetical protein